MIRLHIVVEGQTEETFVNRVLTNHFGQFDISVDARRVETSRHGRRIHRGGLIGYQKVRKDLTLWMREDQNIDAYFTTMFDFYALPEDFPFCPEAKKLITPCLIGSLSTINRPFRILSAWQMLSKVQN